MEEENTEVLFESWALYYMGKENEKHYLFNPWKRRYCVIHLDETGAEINIYEKKPKNLLNAPSKCCISLRSPYTIEKLYHYNGGKFVCRLIADGKKRLVAFVDEKLFHLFAFFVQTQTKIREELEHECFIVRPDNTESQQMIGARQNMCLLHISQHGVILALQLSKCILAWWPLRCIKCYESLSRQQFVLEAGRRAPMGEGVYAFNTRLGHDNAIYDRLDNYIMQAAGLRQIVYRSASQSESTLDSSVLDVLGQLDCLQSLATVRPDSRFTSQLQRISRSMYDQIANNHFGSLRKPSHASRNSAESGTSALPDHNDSAFNRSVSQVRIEQMQQNDTTRTPPVDVKPPSLNVSRPNMTSTPCKDGGGLPQHSYENEEIENVTMTSRKIKQQQVTSSYLSMSSPQQSQQKGQGSSARLNHGTSAPHIGLGTSLKTPNNNSPHFTDMHGSGQFHSLQEAPNGHAPPPIHPTGREFLSLQRQERSNAIPIVNYSNRPGNESAQVSFSVSGSNIAGSPNNDCPDRSVGTPRAESFPRGERAISNQYTNQFHYARPHGERVSTTSDPPTPYEEMNGLDLPVYPPESSSSYTDGESLYPPAYGRKSILYSYADPRRVKLGNGGNVGNSPGGNGPMNAENHEYLYPQNANQQSELQQQHFAQNSQPIQQSRDLKPPPIIGHPHDHKPPMMKPKPAPRPTDLYASPKAKNKTLRKSVSNPDLLEAQMNGNLSPIDAQRPNSFGASRDGIYESPNLSPDGLAFANNMFKEELVAEQTGQTRPLKPPPLKMAIFNQQSPRPETNPRDTSVSPISSHGIQFTPNSKSFKRSQPIEHSSPQSPANSGGWPSISSPSSVTSHNSSAAIMRRQKSAGMEGRRLPSLPADAILGVNPGQGINGGVDGPQALPSPDSQYEKVGNPDSFV